MSEYTWKETARTRFGFSIKCHHTSYFNLERSLALRLASISSHLIFHFPTGTLTLLYWPAAF